MKKIILLTALLLQLNANAQSSWQWGKTGGSSQTFSQFDYEGVYSIVTDSQKNSYMLSKVAMWNLQVDGHTKQGYDIQTGTPQDIMLASFGCDGSYRWSKIIGGRFKENVQNLQIDDQDNIYVSGNFVCTDENYPPRIENDVIYPQTPNWDCRTIFLTKFNSDGVMQWINRPQPTTSDLLYSYTAFSTGLSTDTLGNSYQLVCVPQGLYGGMFLNNLTNSNFYGQNFSWFVFKYNNSGVLISGTPLNIQCNSLGGIKFWRNHNTGNFYITGQTNNSIDNVVIGGESITKNMFLACFNSTGVFQWKKEDAYTPIPNAGFPKIVIHNLVFDDLNNMYLGLRMDGNNSDSFLGFSRPEMGNPNAVIKVNENADTLLWGTSAVGGQGNNQYGDLKIKGNVLAFTNMGISGPTTSYIWGSQSVVGSGSVQVLLAQFNKDTGACLGLNFLANNLTTGGNTDYGMSVAIDASGDYLVGGCFQTAIYMSNGAQLLNNGAVQTDFFITKFASQACSPLVTENFENTDKRLLIAPNPAVDKVSINYEFNDVFSSKTVEVIDMLGRTLLNLRINDMKGTAAIDCSQYLAGQYVIVLKENGKVVGNSKLVVGK